MYRCWFGITLAVLGQISLAADMQPDAGGDPAHKPYHEIEKSMRALLQKEARASSKKDRAAAAYEMVYLLV